MDKALIILKLITLISSFAGIAIVSIVSIALVEMKARSLYPVNSPIKRTPPLYVIRSDSIPDDEKGKELLAYSKTVMRNSGKLFLALVVTAILSLMIPT